jgi:hypothetical protein
VLDRAPTEQERMKYPRIASIRSHVSHDPGLREGTDRDPHDEGFDSDLRTGNRVDAVKTFRANLSEPID